MDKNLAPETARFFTAARKFPKMLGKLPDGTRIWGGPYTLLQGIVLILAAAVALLTKPMWSFGSFIIDIPVAAAVAIGLGLLSGRIPTQNRNVLTVGMSAMHAIGSPVQGRRNCRRVTIRRPHRVRSDAAIDWSTDELEQLVDVPVEPAATPAATPVPAPVAAPAAEPTPTPATATPRAVTGVERLLQQTRAK